LDSTGKAYCWGQDSLFQLGNGDTFVVNASTPVPVGTSLTFTSITAGRNHTCGLTSDGNAFCWGSNDHGQIGAGTLGSRFDTPQPAAGGTKFRMLSAGGVHTCGITTSGSALCWGGNESGQLGDADTVATGFATPVSGGLTFAWIDAGATNTCGVTTAGAVYCWGQNGYGQVGSGSAGGELVKSPSAINVAGVTFTQVTVGTRHACAVGPGAAYCWGSNVLGALGNELQAMKQGTPQKIATPQF
jgi:alpha-tubulin suppressor-like RCC1 family protein